MPVIESAYKAPFFLGNNHVQTVTPTLFRTVRGVSYVRERIATPDGDFIDLDISSCGSDRAVILSHGLEGSSDKAYVMGMAKAFKSRSWDSVAFNFRGCSGEPNRGLPMYHSGKTEDLHLVIMHVLSTRKYRTITLVGFSLGANLTLKYAGEMGKDIPTQVKSAIGISAPCDLASSTGEILKLKNRIYEKRFLKTLLLKVKQKEHLFPLNISREYSQVKNLEDFDNRYTAPMHGFADARDYWECCSCRKFISNTAVPMLILSAKDDPILGPDCFPYKEAHESRNIFLEVPEQGGHVGFISFNDKGEFYDEQRAAEFALQYC